MKGLGFGFRDLVSGFGLRGFGFGLRGLVSGFGLRGLGFGFSFSSFVISGSGGWVDRLRRRAVERVVARVLGGLIQRGTALRCAAEEGSYLRLIDFWITQL